MRVATFGPSTGWAGRGIDYDNGQFTLEGHGSIPPQALLDYDQRAQIDWAYAGLREWVQQIAYGYAATPAATAYAQPSAQTRPQTTGKPFPVWAIVLIVVLALVLPLGIGAAILIPAITTTVNMVDDQMSLAKGSAVKAGVRSIQVGIESWAVDHGGLYPDASLVTMAGMRGSTGFAYIDQWPTDPYALGSVPMTQGTGPGQFTYTVAPNGKSFEIVAYGENGEPILTLP